MYFRNDYDRWHRWVCCHFMSSFESLSLLWNRSIERSYDQMYSLFLFHLYLSHSTFIINCAQHIHLLILTEGNWIFLIKFNILWLLIAFHYPNCYSLNYRCCSIKMNAVDDCWVLEQPSRSLDYNHMKYDIV